MTQINLQVNFNIFIPLCHYLVSFFLALSCIRKHGRNYRPPMVTAPNRYLNTLIKWQIDINAQRVAKKDIMHEGTIPSALSKCLLLAILQLLSIYLVGQCGSGQNDSRYLSQYLSVILLFILSNLYKKVGIYKKVWTILR